MPRWLEGVEVHGQGMAGAKQEPWEGSTQGEPSPPGPRGGGGRGSRDGLFGLWWRMPLRDKRQEEQISITDGFETLDRPLCSLLFKAFLWPAGGLRSTPSACHLRHLTIWPQATVLGSSPTTLLNASAALHKASDSFSSQCPPHPKPVSTSLTSQPDPLSKHGCDKSSCSKSPSTARPAARRINIWHLTFALGVSLMPLPCPRPDFSFYGSYGNQGSHFTCLRFLICKMEPVTSSHKAQCLAHRSPP